MSSSTSMWSKPSSRTPEPRCMPAKTSSSLLSASSPCSAAPRASAAASANARRCERGCVSESGSVRGPC